MGSRELFSSDDGVSVATGADGEGVEGGMTGETELFLSDEGVVSVAVGVAAGGLFNDGLHFGRDLLGGERGD